MKSVGEVMGIGRSFQEALQKACQSLEINRNGLGADGRELTNRDEIMHSLENASLEPCVPRVRCASGGWAFRFPPFLRPPKIDKWFLYQIEELVQIENTISTYTIETLPRDLLFVAKQKRLRRPPDRDTC